VALSHAAPHKNNIYWFEDGPEKFFLGMAGKLDADVMIYGHTHKPYGQDFYGKIFINAGSVGKPKDGDPRAFVTIVEACLPEYFAEKLKKGGVVIKLQQRKGLLIWVWLIDSDRCLLPAAPDNPCNKRPQAISPVFINYKPFQLKPCETGIKFPLNNLEQTRALLGDISFVCRKLQTYYADYYQTHKSDLRKLEGFAENKHPYEIGSRSRQTDPNRISWSYG
jgi:hypothetical protein